MNFIDRVVRKYRDSFLDNQGGFLKGAFTSNIRIAEHTGTVFDGNTVDAHGDVSNKPTYTIWTVTDNIIVWAFAGLINTDLTEGGATATLSVGAVGNVAKLIAATNAVNLDDGEVWTDTGAEVGIDIVPASGPWFINDGADIIETTAAQDIDAGQIDYVMVWSPCNASSNVVSSGALS